MGILNPFEIAGEAVGKVAADGWSGIMLSIWGAGTSVLTWTLGAMDDLLTPDVRASGPAGDVYRTTFWMAGALVIFMMIIQIGFALWRRRGEDIGRVVVGAAQFVMVWALGLGYAVLLLTAVGGLTHGLLNALFKVDAWSAVDLTGDIDVGKSAVELALVTTLGFLGIFMWIGAIGHFVLLLGRNAALVILTAVAPIAAAGLVSDVGRTWFWKTVRWFHAAAFTPVITVLTLGIGTKLATAVGQGKAHGSAAALGLAITSVVVLLISLVSPMALFRLLAFVDPGTTSGASARAGLAAAGGVSGILGGGSQDGGGQSSSAASTRSPSGQSQGESQGEDATTGRFTSALSSIGGGVGKGIGAVSQAGAQLASVSADEMNQSGVGDSSYYPDYQRGSQQFNPDKHNGGSGGGGPMKPPSTSGAGGEASEAAEVASVVPPVA